MRFQGILLEFVHDRLRRLEAFLGGLTLGFLAGGYLDFSLLAFGGVGVIIALIYIQLNPQWRKPEPQAAATSTSSTALDQLDD